MLVSLHNNYYQSLGTVHRLNGAFTIAPGISFAIRPLYSVAAILSLAWMAASGENGGELLLALELSPVASLTTVLNEVIKYMNSRLYNFCNSKTSCCNVTR